MLNNLFYRLQHGRRKLNLIANAAAAFLILFLLYTVTKNGSYTQNVIQKFYGDGSSSSKYDLFTLETVDLSHLSKHKLSENFFYSRRIINTRYVSGERKTLTTVDQSLFKQSSKVPNKNLENFPRKQDLPLILDVSVPKTVAGANSLSFGIATPIERLLDSLPQLMHWLPNTGAMLHVISPADPRTKNVTEHIRNLGINITIVESNDKFPINYFSLLPLLYHTRLPGTKWLAMIDDDTFIPDLGFLLSHLQERYNPKLPQVISGVSDDIVQINKHGLMPFGGGGIFLSVPFAASIVDNNYPGTAGAIQGGHFPTPPNPSYSPFGPPADSPGAKNYILDHDSPYRHSTAMKSCLATSKYEGDQIFSDCINKQTTIRPQYDIGLHQMDLKGDISGFFESGRRSLTLHHWKTWFQVDIPSVASVTKICGKDCFLQRFRFKGLNTEHSHPDETWVLNNGYSITKYPNGIKGLSKDLPEPPPPPPSPPSPELPDPKKDPITANPRFLRPKTATWTSWPDLGVGEEVIYEGVLGVIIDKSMAKGGPPDKKTDPFKGFGNLEWVPMSPPFADEGSSALGDQKKPDGESTDELKKHEAEKESDKNAETTSKGESSTDNIPATAANAKDEISHFQRFRRALSEIPRNLMTRNSASEFNSTLEREREQYEEDLEDTRRFWESIEKTWGGEADRFEHALGPLRRELKRDEEVVRFLMVESVGGWGDPGKQDTENVQGSLIPEKLIKGFAGDPEKKKEEEKHGASLIEGGDPGFEKLWGKDPPKPDEGKEKEDEKEKEKEKSKADDKVTVGGGSVIANRAEKPSSSSSLTTSIRTWFESTSQSGSSESKKSKSKNGEPLMEGGIGGVDRPTVDWVRQTYVRKRWNPGGLEGVVLDGDGDGKAEDEVIELVWVH